MMTMLGFLADAAGFCCASATLAQVRPSAAINSAIPFFMVMPPLLFESKNRLPVVLHADHGPAFRLRLVPGLVELADLRLPVVGILARGVVVMHDQHEALAGAGRGELQHLQVAVGIAEGGDGTAPDDAVDPHR